MLKIITLFVIVTSAWISNAAKTYTTLQINAQDRIVLELAQTESEKRKGLMFRKKLAENQGMLFCWSHPGHYGIWMKNTLIPLDILWLDAKKRVVYYRDHAPICQTDNCPNYFAPSPIQSQYIIELNSGVRQKLNIQREQILKF